jgi:hypothetical protein
MPFIIPSYRGLTSIIIYFGSLGDWHICSWRYPFSSNSSAIFMISHLLRKRRNRLIPRLFRDRKPDCKTFMKTVHRCLEDDGIFLLHTIGGNESQIEGDPWINKYIFPNGMLPSISQISKAVEGLFVMEDLHNIGPHYEKTLMAWHENFQKAWTMLKKRYDEKFKRMWDYYLLSCAGAFRARNIQIWQLVLTKYGTPQPSLR